MRRYAVDSRIRELGLAKAGNERKVAAILFTYRCTISCRHCLFACRGARPDVVMDASRCVRYLGQLHELGRVVHIAGGEPMLYWDVLAEVLDRAARAGVMLGRADRTPGAEVMARGPAQANFIARTLSEAGPIGLAEFARREHGFHVPEQSQQKCALCFVTRCFLREHCPDILGPGEIYD